jgi:hypothetical protein
MAAGSTYTPIATTTLGATAASVTFSTISGAYTDLVLVLAGGTDAASGWGLRFNSDTGSNYSRTYLTGTGSAAGNGTDTNQTTADIAYNGILGNNTNYNSIVNIMNYSNTTTYKTAISRSNNAATGVDASTSLWRSTSAITTIEIRTTTAGKIFNVGSIFTLYGIAAA